MLLSLQFTTLTIKKKNLKINVTNIARALFSCDSNINVLFILPFLLIEWAVKLLLISSLVHCYIACAMSN